MIIYLYIKTHSITGLKYLGKTKNTNPHKYHGSGVYWLNHLKSHGFHYETTILKECSSNDEVCYWGTYYSELYNVVESNEWANLKPEMGEGGSPKGINRKKQSPAHIEKLRQSRIGKIISPEQKIKISNALKGKPKSDSHKINLKKPKTEEHCKNLSLAKRGKNISQEHKDKISKSTKGRKWWTNGVIETMAHECPDNSYINGRLPKS